MAPRPSVLPLHLRLGVVREEELLAVDLVAGNGGLAVCRGEPFDEGRAELFLDVWMPCRVHEHDAILIEKARVALDDYLKIAPVLEAEPSASIGKRICVHRRRRVQGR